MNKQPSKKSILFMAQIPPPVHGASLRNESVMRSPLVNENFNVYPLPLRFVDEMKHLGKFSLKKIWLMLVYAGRMLSILMRKRIDVVYFTMSPVGGAFYRDILFITILKIFGKRPLLHFRRKGIRQTAKSAIGAMLVKYAFRNSALICLSQHHTLDVADFAKGRIYLVPNGIKIERAYDEIEKSVARHAGQPVQLLFLSNLTLTKGVLELLTACEILKNKGHHFSASLVGSEWDLSYEDVKKIIREKGLEGVVHVDGPRYGNEKLASFASADIFVFPTYFELFPGVILEAMQFGKAIVSTFEGSIPEMIDNNVNGILVPQRDSRALAEGIETFLSSESRRREFGMRAREKFHAEFTLPIFENNMNRVFQDAAANL